MGTSWGKEPVKWCLSAGIPDDWKQQMSLTGLEIIPWFRSADLLRSRELG